MNRRRFLGVAAAGAAVAGGVAFEGFWRAPNAFAVTRHDLGGPADGRRHLVAQITDLHLRELRGVHRRIAAAVNAARPDLVVLTGDSVDRADALPLLDGFLALLDPRVPKLAIPGNWEHWSGVDLGALAAAYGRAGGRLLVNETVAAPGTDGALLVTGLDDLIGGRPDLASAVRGVPDAAAHLLLAHCPLHRDHLRPRTVPSGDPEPAPPPPPIPRFTAMLSGHTHGGQVRLLGWAPRVPPGSGRYVAGWFRDGDGPPLYVSRGIGTSVVPVRLGATPEVALFTLRL